MSLWRVYLQNLLVEMNKIINEAAFINAVKFAEMIAVGGFRRSGTPQQLLRLIRESFNDSGSPSKITLMFSSTPTDPGVDILAHKDLLHCTIGSFYGSIPLIRSLIQENKIQGYSLPQGQIALLFREIGRGSPGLISNVGRDTFVDPEIDGGKLNSLTQNDAVEIIDLHGKSFMFYKSHAIDIVLLRGSISDCIGNISMKDEPIKTEFLAMAQAAKSSGGNVFVQVAGNVKSQFHPQEVDLPAHLVDGVIMCTDPEVDHRQTNQYHFHVGLLSKQSGRAPSEDHDVLFKQLIAKRALKELRNTARVNLGQGLPELVAIYAKEKPDRYHHVITYLESGVIGGIPERRPDFGAAMGPHAFLTQDSQFAGFNGGQLDCAILSFAQLDQHANINVSRIGSEDFGCGGFMDITHTTKKLVFVGSFTTKGLEIQRSGSTLSILKEGTVQKCVSSVSQITYSPKLQEEKSQEIIIITERCVFEIHKGHLILTEVADGVNLQKDILDQMEFVPDIAHPLIPLLWD